MGILGHREAKGKAMTSSLVIDEDLFADEESRFFEAVRDEFACVIARDTIYYALHYRGERHWTCFWCGAWYTRDHRPAACQRCGSTIFRSAGEGRIW